MDDSRDPLTLLMLAGLPGTGKTTLAYELGRLLRWTVLDKDVLNAVLLDAGLPQSQAGWLSYEQLFKLAYDLVVRQRRSVILDTAGRQPRILEQSKVIAQQAPAQLRVVRCVAPRVIRLERLAGRIARPSQWMTDETTDEEEAQWYAHLPADTLIVATDQAVDKLLPTILTFVKNNVQAERCP